MEIGYVGLGKMGKNMVMHLLQKGHSVTATDIDKAARKEVDSAGARTVGDLKGVVDGLSTPRTIWLMVPAGEITENIVGELATLLEAGDTVINGGNEFFRDSQRHGEKLHERGVHFMDVGVSGGFEGARDGACMMIGGEASVYARHEDLFRDLCAPQAYQFFPGIGAGHYVKMVHNGIEYGMMQSIAEGFDILRNAKDFDIDLAQAARVYNRKSIIASRLIGWLEEGYDEYGTDLYDISGTAGSGGAAGLSKSEAKWTDDIAALQNTPDNVIKASIEARVYSQKSPNYQAKVINTLRNMFGGHRAK